ncbi:NAD-binding component of TrK potassium transporter [Gammaproteobacteria bacterium]|nr:NAD-binding component of TrK potassium transporter [Gammaproteobacteria bacterium]
MKILILGAGQVGSSVAQILSKEPQNDITVVDSNALVLASLKDRLDIRTVKGHASHPNVMEQAGALGTDILIAVTSSDETNMVACELGKLLFNIKTKIARIRSSSYLNNVDIFGNSEGKLAVDVTISPESLVTEQIKNVIELSGATRVLPFASGRALLVSSIAQSGGRLIGSQIKELPKHLPGIDIRIAAIFRGEDTLEVTGNTILQENDEVFFLSARQHARLMMAELRPLDKKAKKIVIAGGGNIGMRLADALEDDVRVKIIEHNYQNAQKLSARLSKAIVLSGDCADEELLREENIEQTDVFCAVTNDEQANILSAMLAKRLGAKRVMSLINRPSYVELVESESQIDVVFSPQQVTIGALLAYIRRGDIVKVYSLGDSEAIEIIAHGTLESSQVIGRHHDEIQWPEGVVLAALIRGNKVLMYHHDSIIEAEDHAILFVSDKTSIQFVEELFHVST